MKISNYKVGLAVGGNSKFFNQFMQKYHDGKLGNISVGAIFSNNLSKSTLDSSKKDNQFSAPFLDLSKIITNETPHQKKAREYLDVLNFFRNNQVELIVTDNFEFGSDLLLPEVNVIYANYGVGKISDGQDLVYHTANLVPTKLIDLIIDEQFNFYSRLNINTPKGQKHHVLYKEHDFEELAKKSIADDELKKLQEYPLDEKYFRDKLDSLLTLSNSMHNSLIDGKIELLNTAINSYFSKRLEIKSNIFGIEHTVYNNNTLKAPLNIDEINKYVSDTDSTSHKKNDKNDKLTKSRSFLHLGYM